MPETRISVKLEDILPNPHRDLDFDPISEKKVEKLSQSIRHTGYWENLIGRRNAEGKVELAFGHQRLEALKRVYGPAHQIEMLIKDLSDQEMLRMMSMDNDEAYNCSVAAIDNSVKAARKLLSEDDEVALSSVGPEVKRVRVGAPMIANLLSKPVNQVEKSIERLNEIEKGTIDPKALYLLPTASAADTFINLVYENRVQPEYQLKLARVVCTQKKFGHLSMGDTVQLVLDALRPTRGEHWEQEILPGTEERWFKSHLSRIHELNWFMIGLLASSDFEDVFATGKVSDGTRDRFLIELMGLANSVGPFVEKLRKAGISVEQEDLSRRSQERSKKKGNRGLYGEKVTGRKRQLESLESRNALRASLGMEPIKPREKKAKRSKTPPVPATIGPTL